MSFNLLEPLDPKEKEALMAYCQEIIQSGAASSLLSLPFPFLSFLGLTVSPFPYPFLLPCTVL